MPNPNPPLITNEYCYKHRKSYPASDWCDECAKDTELSEMLDEIRAGLLELRQFINENPQYNGEIIYDYEIDKMIETLGNAIVNLEI